MSDWADSAIALVAANPNWAGLIVFLVAASESIVLAGYVVPGTVILLAVGGLVGAGHLPLWPVLAWAALGAIVGDGVSYWLGRRYRGSIRERWPFTRYPGLVERGEAFFARHGAMSVALGRFLPVLRPIIPVVAGISGMPPTRFYVVNVLSALAWSPAFIVPGMLAGASLHLLQGISPRLALAVVAAIAAMLAAWWLGRLLVLRTIPLLMRTLDVLYAFTQRRPGSWLQRLSARFDPSHPAAAALLITYALLFAVLTGFLQTLENVLERDALMRADQAISTLVQGFRNPLTDPILMVVTSLGDFFVTLSVAVALVAWLLLMRRWRLAVTVGGALLLTALSVPLMKSLLEIPRPAGIIAGLDVYAFPSGHTTMVAAVYGVAAWIVAGGMRLGWRPVVYVAALSWMVLMALSRVYLGAHWPSDVFAGLCLGLLAPVTLAALYHALGRVDLHPVRLGATLVTVLALAGAWHVPNSWAVNSARYAVQHADKRLDVVAWRAGVGIDLPDRRADLGGELEEPYVLQWLGSAAALRAALVDAGWREPVAWDVGTAIDYLRAGVAIERLPVVPRLADGRMPVLTLIRAAPAPGERWVLRAWPSGFTDPADDTPLLLASLVLERTERPAQLLTITRTQPLSPAEARPLLPPFDPPGAGLAAAGRDDGDAGQGPVRAMAPAGPPR